MDLQHIISLVKETKGIITNREMAAHVKEKGVADYVCLLYTSPSPRDA